MNWIKHLFKGINISWTWHFGYGKTIRQFAKGYRTVSEAVSYWRDKQTQKDSKKD